MLPTSHIQKPCAAALTTLLLCFSLQFCGSNSQPLVQTLTFEDSSVPFQNSTCSTSITLVNNASVAYSLAFLTATFEDDIGETYDIQLDQNEVTEAFDPMIVSAGGITHGEVDFSLQNANLTPPFRATVILVGITGGQVTHFVGNFTCE